VGFAGGFERAQVPPRGANLDRRRRYGDRGDRYTDRDPAHRELGADQRRPAGRCGAGRAPCPAEEDRHALFNGVGGDTVALIALAEAVDTKGFSAFKHGEAPTVHIVVASLFAAIIGSVSFWGSLIAFGKLQEILPGRPIGIGKAQQPLSLLSALSRTSAPFSSRSGQTRVACASSVRGN
jgi:hypothetical protein